MPKFHETRKKVGLIACLGVQLCGAQIHPQTLPSRPVQDPTLVLNDRGSVLEVLPAERVAPQSDPAGHHRVRRLPPESPAGPIGPGHLGVVFNHSSRQQGYISGEIAFKVKAGHSFAAPDPVLYPGFKQAIKPDVFVVNARTPTEFVALLQRLQQRKDLDWVEPTVLYSSAP